MPVRQCGGRKWHLRTKFVIKHMCQPCDVWCAWRRRDQFTLDLMEKVPQGAGSGTIWDTDGHVVTNAHVIAGASDLQVL